MKLCELAQRPGAPRNDAGVVATLGLKDTIFSIVRCCCLRLGNCCRGLEGDSAEPSSAQRRLNSLEQRAHALEVDVFAVADPSLNSSTSVRLCAERPVGPLDKRVVVLAPGLLGSGESAAVLESLRGGDGEHGVRKHRLELVEHGLSKADGALLDHARDGAADRVVAVARLDNALGARTGTLSSDQLSSKE